MSLPSTLRGLIERVEPLDQGAMAAARHRQSTLTKPPGSLGRLEALSELMAGIQGRVPPLIGGKTIVVAAADHGIAAAGVSAYPQAVTAQMVYNFLRGGAAISVLAKQAGARLVVVDFGVAEELPVADGLLDRRVAAGTRDFSRHPAMTEEQAIRAMTSGYEIALQESRRGTNVIATGEMGIANTTSASAIVAALTGRPAAAVTGRGTGVDEAGLERKVAVVEQALTLHAALLSSPLGVLSAVGGFEIAGLAGLIIGAAAERVAVVVDGFITGAAALLAVRLCPATREYLIPSHLSTEPGHLAVYEALRLTPLFDLGMRLGEGTGAALALHFIEAAVGTLAGMATFAEAGVSGPEG